MNYSIKMKQEKSILRWGGLSGIVGGVLLILVMGFVAVFISPEPPNLAGHLTRFSEIRVIRIIENCIYLTALILQVPLFLTLNRALKKNLSAAAHFGNAFCIMGILVMAASATPHVAHSKLVALFNAAGTTAAEQASIAIIFQAVWGIFDAMLYVGFFIVSAGLTLLGIGLLRSSPFKSGVGRAVTILGAVGLITAILQMIDPASFIGAVSYFAGIISYLILSSQVFRLSRISE